MSQRHAHFVPLTKEDRAVAVANGATVTALCGIRWSPTDTDPPSKIDRCERCADMAQTAWIL